MFQGTLLFVRSKKDTLDAIIHSFQINHNEESVLFIFSFFIVEIHILWYFIIIDLYISWRERNKIC